MSSNSASAVAESMQQNNRIDSINEKFVCQNPLNQSEFVSQKCQVPGINAVW